MKKSSAVVGTGLLMLLAACGGGGSDSPPAPPTPPVTAQVPTSASATVDGFIGYLMQLVVASANTLAPVDVSAVTPPTSDTTEPTPIAN
jgi:hypothetical protein